MKTMASDRSRSPRDHRDSTRSGGSDTSVPDRCAVCLEDIERDDRDEGVIPYSYLTDSNSVTMICGHTLHGDCHARLHASAQVAREVMKCPMCREHEATDQYGSLKTDFETRVLRAAAKTNVRWASHIELRIAFARLVDDVTWVSEKMSEILRLVDMPSRRPRECHEYLFFSENTSGSRWLLILTRVYASSRWSDSATCETSIGRVHVEAGEPMSKDDIFRFAWEVHCAMGHIGHYIAARVEIRDDVYRVIHASRGTCTAHSVYDGMLDIYDGTPDEDQGRSPLI